MYKDCIVCRKLGDGCDGPCFFGLSAEELVAWCKDRKNYLKYSNARIADMANMAKGTVDGFFSGSHLDFKYETIRPIVRVLVGKFRGNPCPDPSEGERVQFEKTIRSLEEGTAWRDDKISHFETENKTLYARIAKMEEKYENDVSFVKKQLEDSKKTSVHLKTSLIVVSVFLGISLLLIISALIIDKLNGDIGFFWL